MEEGKSLLTLFEENGYVIKDVTTFAKEADSVDLNELVEKLAGLERQMTASVNVTDFGRSMKVDLDRIKNIVNNDELYLGSATRNDFETSLAAVAENFVFVQNYTKAEEIMLFQKQNMYDAMRQIYELDKKKDLDDATRTSEALKLLGNKKKCENAYRDALSFYNEQKKAYEKSMKDFNLTDYKNGLLQTINALDDEVKKLSINAETKEKLSSTISDVRSKVALFGIESMKSKSEFDALCKRYGLESTKKNTFKIDSTKKKEEPVKPEIKPEIEPQPKVEIETAVDLFDALCALNPSEKLKLVGDKIECKGKISDLKLPEGFNYSEVLGINNKKTDTDSYIALGEAKKENLIDKLEHFTAPKRIPQGKTEVKRVNRAVMSSYIGSIITFGAIAGIAAIPLSVGIVPAALTGGILSGIGQKIYGKLVKNNPEKAPEFEEPFYQDYPEAAMWSVATLRKFENGANKLLNLFKNRKKAKALAKEEQKEEVLAPEELVSPEIEEMVPEMAEQEVLDADTPSIEDEIFQAVQDRFNEFDEGLGGR